MNNSGLFYVCIMISFTSTNSLLEKLSLHSIVFNTEDTQKHITMYTCIKLENEFQNHL